MIKYSEQFMEHIEYTFAAFCNIVLRNAAINAYRDFGRKQRREVSLNYLMSETPFEVIERVVAGELEAVDAVLQHYTPRIKYLSMHQGRINDEIQNRLKAQLIQAIFKFRFDR